MNPRVRAVDWRAALAALLAGVMAVVYVAVVRDQGESPAAWFLVLLVTGACLCAYGTFRQAAHRTVALAVAGVVLLLLGVLGILTIGLPVLVAGVLALAASARSIERPAPG